MKASSVVALVGILSSATISVGAYAVLKDIKEIRKPSLDEPALPWYKRDLEARANSVPGSTSTKTTNIIAATVSISNIISASIGVQVRAESEVLATSSGQATLTSTPSSQAQSTSVPETTSMDPTFLSQRTSQKECLANVDCTSGNCVNGRCAPTTNTGNQGQYCSSSNQCDSNLFCSRNKCKVKAVTGGLCYQATECQTDICVNRVCIQQKSVAIGGICKASIHCAGSNVACLQGVCTKKLAKGGICYKAEGCKSNKCIHRRCS